MERLVKGDVIVMLFPFSDLSASKKRPALILANLEDNDFILCQITSQARIDDHSIVISNEDFLMGTLNLTSLIKPNRLFTADKSLIERKIGCLKKKKIDEVIEGACKILRTG
jgi:mRNA interferase MazF